MSEISFEHVEIENFLSIEKGALNLADRGLLLIQGENNDDPSADSNGSGKSSVVDAICWALFGVTARGVAGDDVINHTAGKGCRVTLTLDDGGTTYKIVRHRKHKSGKNRLKVKQGRKDLTKGTDKLTQEVVGSIIGCSLDVFQAAVYAGQEQMPDLPGMTDKHLKLIVEEAAGINILEAAYEIARRDARSQQVGVERLEVAIKDARERFESTKSEIESVREKSSRWEEDRDAKMGTVRSQAQEQIEAAKALREKLSKFDAEALVKRRDELEKVIAEVEGSKPDDSKWRMLESEVAGTEEAIRSVNREADTARKRISDSENLVGQPCDRCGKPYTSDDIVSVVDSSKKELGKLERRLAELLEIRLDSMRQRDDAKAEYEAQSSAASPGHLYKQVAKITEGLHKLEKERSALQTLVKTAQALRERLRELESESNPFESMIKPLQEKLSDLASDIEGQEDELKQGLEALEALEGAVKVFSPTGVRGTILDTVTPFLNEQTSHYLGVLSDGNITAEWRTVGETKGGEAREKFHIRVENSKGANSFGGLSGGERRKVRIATAMALQDLVASRAFKPIKLFIADEVDDALDAAGLERLMSILEDKARAVGTTLIISHNDIGDWVRNQVTVKKSGGTSIIEEVA